MITTDSVIPVQQQDPRLQLTNLVTLNQACLSADFEGSQAGHIQEGPASVMDDAAREDAHPSRGGSAQNPSSTAAGTSGGRTTVSDPTRVCVCVCALTAPTPPISN